MNTFNRWIQKYLVYALPVVLATMAWGSFQSDPEIRASGSALTYYLWEGMSWTLMTWFLSLFIFLVLLVFRKDTQESTIKYLAGIKERDEREQAITGIAARRSFVATTGLLISLLFISCLTFSLARLPDQTIDGKKRSLSLGFHFSATDYRSSQSEDGQVIYEHRDLPLSKTGIILLVLIWQVSAFRIKARKEMIID